MSENRSKVPISEKQNLELEDSKGTNSVVLSHNPRLFDLRGCDVYFKESRSGLEVGRPHLYSSLFPRENLAKSS